MEDWWNVEAYRTIYSEIVRSLSRGHDIASAQQEWMDRHGQPPGEHWEGIAEAAQRSVRAAGRAQGLAPNQPLGAALGDEQPPGPNVSVRFLASFTDIAGHTHYRIVNVNATWDTPFGDVVLLAQADAEALMAYHGMGVPSISLVPPMLF